MRCRVFILLWRFFGTAITTLALRELALPREKRTAVTQKTHGSEKAYGKALCAGSARAWSAAHIASAEENWTAGPVATMLLVATLRIVGGGVQLKPAVTARPAAKARRRSTAISTRDVTL